MNRRHNTPWWASEGNGPLGSGPYNPQLNSRRTILERLCENGPLYAMETRYGGTMYGKVELKGGRIFINSFQMQAPDSPTEAKFISLKELLSQFNNGSSELPKTAFFRLTPQCLDGGIIIRDDSFDSFEVIIETEGLSPREKNLILLCSALRGESYKGLPLVGGVTMYRIYSAPPAVVEEIRSNDPKTRLKEGGVYGMYGTASFCVIALEDCPYSFQKVGVIVEGLQRMKDLVPKSLYLIEECGLVI